jgi:hypothetical protein
MNSLNPSTAKALKAAGVEPHCTYTEACRSRLYGCAKGECEDWGYTLSQLLGEVEKRECRWHLDQVGERGAVRSYDFTCWIDGAAETHTWRFADTPEEAVALALLEIVGEG